MNNLNGLMDESLEARFSANQEPISYVEAVAHYLAHRRDGLVGELDECTEFQADAVSNRISALSAIAGAGGARVPKKKWAKGRLPGQEARLDVKVIHLARVLTPDGWEEKILPAYTALADQALEAIVSKKEVGANLALLAEVRRFLRHLYTVAREAETARALEVRRMKGLTVDV